MTDDLPTPSDEKYWGTCLHEAAHAWAFHQLLGEPIAAVAVSMRPEAFRGGITFPDSSQPLLRLGGHPLDGLDPVVRQRADRWLVMLLIGDHAEALSIRPPSGGWARPAVAAPPPSLPSDVAASLAVAETDPRVDFSQSDSGQARELAEALVGPVTAGLYIGWAMAEARQAVFTHAAPIHALASALWREPIIDGHKAVRILIAAARS
jgi:hypothetical protein